MSLKLQRFIVIYSIFLLGALVWLTVSLDSEETSCQEDMPCWDCKTMGNRICGPLKAEIRADGMIIITDKNKDVGIVYAENVKRLDK